MNPLSEHIVFLHPSGKKSFFFDSLLAFANDGNYNILQRSKIRATTRKKEKG